MREKITVRSPGRINLIGEHTDYNMGFVLPAAIDKAIEFTIEPTTSSMIKLEALDLNEYAEIDPRNSIKSNKEWVNYCIGIIDQLNKSDLKIAPFKCSFGGNIPLGAGLSSSAALSCGLLMAINEFFNLGLSRVEIAQMAQKSENEFVGVSCGIMDQYACVFGEKDTLIKIDCRSLKHEIVKGDFEGYSLLLCDTKVKHSLASTEYNTRKTECETGVIAIQLNNKFVKSLRDATIQDLEAVKSNISQTIFDRCEYVINENNRVLAAVKAIQKNNIALLGALMFQSHEGLKNKYKVSCAELDVLVELAKKDPCVLGARMMGGGFGGCTINILKSEGLGQFKKTVAKHYYLKTGKEASFYDIKISDGASTL